jgi:hypothetical protein
MGVMLEKWPNKGHEYFKYMYNVRLAAERGSETGWITYDEQFRLMKARFPTSTWLIYVATHEKPKLTMHVVNFIVSSPLIVGQKLTLLQTLTAN